MMGNKQKIPAQSERFCGDSTNPPCSTDQAVAMMDPFFGGKVTHTFLQLFQIARTFDPGRIRSQAERIYWPLRSSSVTVLSDRRRWSQNCPFSRAATSIPRNIPSALGRGAFHGGLFRSHVLRNRCWSSIFISNQVLPLHRPFHLRNPDTWQFNDASRRTIRRFIEKSLRSRLRQRVSGNAR